MTRLLRHGSVAGCPILAAPFAERVGLTHSPHHKRGIEFSRTADSPGPNIPIRVPRYRADKEQQRVHGNHPNLGKLRSGKQRLPDGQGQHHRPVGRAAHGSGKHQRRHDLETHQRVDRQRSHRHLQRHRAALFLQRLAGHAPRADRLRRQRAANLRQPALRQRTELRNSLEFPTENQFTGKQRDSETGNDYFGARYYSSDAARFLTPDWRAQIEPVPYAYLSNPQSLDLYNYVGDNPLSWLDLNGHNDYGLTCFDSTYQQGNGNLVLNHTCRPTGQSRTVKVVKIRLPVPELHPGVLTINDQRVPLSYLTQKKIPSCRAASGVLEYAGDQLSTAGNEMMAMGALAVTGSGVSAFFAPEGAPAEAAGAEAGAQLMEAGGATKTLGKGLKGYAQGGVAGGTKAALISAGVDALTGFLANKMFPLADAADKSVVSKALNPVPEALINEEVGCGGG